MPDIVKQVALGTDDSELTAHMIKLGRIKFIVLALPTLGFIFLGKQFINLWVGKDFAEAYLVAILILVPQMIAALADVALYVMWAKNKHKVKSFVSLGICIINIFLTIVLVQKLGMIGAAISTCLAYVLGYIIFNSIYFHKVLNLDMIRFVKQTFHKMWFGFLVAIIGTFLISFYTATSWFFLGIQSIGITVIYGFSLWFFGFNYYEKQLVIVPLKKVLSSFKKQQQ